MKMMNVRAVSTIVLGASAMAFIALLLSFLVLLAAFGVDVADKVWTGVYPVVAWLIALLVCVRFMAR